MFYIVYFYLLFKYKVRKNFIYKLGVSGFIKYLYKFVIDLCECVVFIYNIVLY